MTLLVMVTLALNLYASQVEAKLESERRVSVFLESIFSNDRFLDTAFAGQDVSVRQRPVMEYLDEAVERVKREFRHEPELQVEILATLAHFYGRLGAEDQRQYLLREVEALR